MSFFNVSGKSALLVNIHDFTVESMVLDSMNTATVINGIKEEVSLKRALTKISGKFDCLKYFIVLSYPWSVSQTHLVRARKDAPFIFSEKDFNEILKNENSLFLKNLKSNFNPDYFKFMEADIMKVFLNGYEISDLNPFKKKIKNIELSIYMSAIKKEVFEAVLSAFNSGFQKKDLIIKTRPAIFYSVLKYFDKNSKNFIMADLREETTEIILIKNDCIEETICFNKGYNFFVRRIMDNLNIPFIEAVSVFDRLNKNILEDNKRHELKNILKSAENDFKESFLKVAEDLGGGYFLPKDLWYFTGNFMGNQFFEIKNKQGENIFEPKEIPAEAKGSFLSLQSSYFKRYLI